MNVKTTIIYFSIFLFTLLIAKVMGMTKRNFFKRNKFLHVFFFLVIFIPLIYLYGMRYNIGVDWHNYIDFYKMILKGKSFDFRNSNFEIGYILINICASIFFHFENGIMFFVGILIFLLLYLNIKVYHLCIDPILAIYIFLCVYFGFACNGLRQLLAVLIVLYGYNYLLRQDIKKYVVTIILAGLIHKSAIFCLLFCFLYELAKKRMLFYKIIMLISAFAIVFLKKPILLLLKKISIYGSYWDYGGSGIVRGLAFLCYVIPIIILIELFIEKKIEEKFRFFVFLMYMQIPIQSLGIFNNVMERMALYCSIVQIILIPAIVKKSKYSQIIKIACYAWYSFYFCIMELVLGGNGIGIYKFY